MDHLLLHCETARVLWNEVFRRVDLAWVMLKTLVAMMASWTNIRGMQPIKTVWKMILLCIIWCLWQEHNERTFEDKERSMEELKVLFFRTLCS